MGIYVSATLANFIICSKSLILVCSSGLDCYCNVQNFGFYQMLGFHRILNPDLSSVIRNCS